jgi:hypothetical protein
MTDGPLMPGATGSALVRVVISEPGVTGPRGADVPRYLLASLSDIRLPDEIKIDGRRVKPVEGKSTKSGNWGDLIALGARRIEWV